MEATYKYFLYRLTKKPLPLQMGLYLSRSVFLCKYKAYNVHFTLFDYYQETIIVSVVFWDTKQIS